MTDTHKPERQKTGSFDPHPEASEIPGSAQPLSLNRQESPDSSDADEADEPKWSSKR